jgi:hypothetical protein
VIAISFETMTSSSVETCTRTAITSASGALDELVGDRAARGVVDQVDERAVPMPGLDEPAFGRPLRFPALPLEGSEGLLGVSRAHEEVDVVLAAGTAACPGREAAAQHERDLGALQHGNRVLHGVDQLFERRLGHRPVVSGLSNRAT